MAGEESQVPKLVTTRPESEIAADLKARVATALEQVSALMDEARGHGLLIRFDGIGPQPPLFKHGVLNLRIEKHY